MEMTEAEIMKMKEEENAEYLSTGRERRELVMAWLRRRESLLESQCAEPDQEKLAQLGYTYQERQARVAEAERLARESKKERQALTWAQVLLRDLDEVELRYLGKLDVLDR